ncbi:MAG: Gfo/Idh/MocA family oxidoreductase [Phycisphaerales bacterium]|nr:Gfo/Idh/MocA family oxidoreductase [Phycisphaerales bacterium]
MTETSRRDFTRLAATTSALAMTGPLGLAAESSKDSVRKALPTGLFGGNDDVRVAVVGLRSRGRNHYNALQQIEGVEVVALCDVDRNILSERARDFNEQYDREVDMEVDFRRLLDRDDIHAVSLATPNHWHALQTIWACDAGKDVYVEKPVCHDMREGMAMVEAAHRNDRVVQTGTQYRSCTANQAAIEWARNGNLGEIKVARGICYKPRRSIGKVKGAQVVPDHIDYDLWVGPAPMKPLSRKNLHYDWHWDFDTGNGDLGNQGVHQMDIARWMIGAKGMPPRVMSAGGRVGYEDDGNTPNTQVVVLDYPDVPLIFEVRGLPRDASARQDKWQMDNYLGSGITAILHCEGGNVVTRHGANAAIVQDPDGREILRFTGTRNHFLDFIEAVRNNDRGNLAAEINEGRLSAALCHAGNASYRIGNKADRKEILGQVSGHEFGHDAMDRMLKHLAANEIDVNQPCLSAGPWLQIDPSTEQFDVAEANVLVSPSARAPYTHELLR